nr:integrase core domain-containing protein [Streptomyces daqingensis]
MSVTRSHSRPKVSNDNPYSEAQFKTTKYMADHPERFDSLPHARDWPEAFTTYYNHEHRHRERRGRSVRALSAVSMHPERLR